jgi:hypothetical protein
MKNLILIHEYEIEKPDKKIILNIMIDSQFISIPNVIKVANKLRIIGNISKNLSKI